ncbi:N-6 DNA methylase [Dactylosporangium sp. CA-233914]|uniref:N-6 DNA methylase n=1 Tax=Dactylosporangium sp. CA-233914 TaxID=3239934 RepID=UPI003D8B4721
MSAPTGYVTSAEIARRTQVQLSAVSNWRTRHADFPEAHLVSGQEVFESVQVAAWLRERRIPRHRLRPDEPIGTSYGDRFQRESATADTEPALKEAQQQAASVWGVMDALRNSHDPASSLELMLGMVYLKACRPDVWQRLTGAGTWPRIYEVLSEASLPGMPGVPPIPVFSRVDPVGDPAVVEAIRLVERAEFGPSTAAEIGEAIFGQLERRLGKSGGHFTPPDVARCLVRLLDPSRSHRVFDPACGSGELLVAAAEHVRGQEGSLDDWRFWGQTAQEWSWRTSVMNLALHGVSADLDFGSHALQVDRFPGLQFDVVLANPPFNLRIDLAPDKPWPFGEPSYHNANFAWLQYVLSKLAPGGRAAVLMPANAAFTTGSRVSAIRRDMVDAGVVECIIALPAGLFRFTNIATMVWILADQSTELPAREMLFIDGRELGDVVDRTRRSLSERDIARIVGEYRQWHESRHVAYTFDETEGFARAVSLDEIRRHDYVLMPDHYVRRAARAPGVGELGQLRDEFEDLALRAAAAHDALATRLAAVVDAVPSVGDGRSTSLGAMCDVLSGPGSVPRQGAATSGTPLVLPRNVNANRIGHDDLDIVPTKTADRLAKYQLVAGDVVTARVGTLGRYGLVGQEQAGWILGPACLRFRPNDQVDPGYLTYYLGTPSARRWLAEHTTGSAIQHISAESLRRMPIWLPSLAKQREIAAILDDFQEASSVFNRLGRNAEELQRVLAARFVELASASAG